LDLQHQNLKNYEHVSNIISKLIREYLRRNSHVDNLNKNGASLLYSLSNLKRFGMPTEVLKSVYCSYVRPSGKYAGPAWRQDLRKNQSDRVGMIQKKL